MPRHLDATQKQSMTRACVCLSVCMSMRVCECIHACVRVCVSVRVRACVFVSHLF